MNHRFSCFLLFTLLLGGCASSIDHSQTVSQQALRMHAKAEVINTSHYPLQTIQVTPGKSKTLRIYIEGDGRAWARRSRPSLDPTPRNPLVLDLMKADPATDKAYIARPCQFVMNSQCNISVWTDLRFSTEAVAATNEALDALKAQGNYQTLELIGFSGGAAIALLAAATRRDIASIRTIAGNLDPAYVNKMHNVSYMPKALSPVKFTHELGDIPQLHFSGADDPIVPPAVYQVYKSRFSKQDCIAGKTVKGANHHHGWRDHWPTLLGEPLPACTSPPLGT
ncbi:alpha/beta hydrolase [Sansalvadorimonas verongulae]|uniref:alpha/beta hydrolase n=1 Tax=Sansalvadorimonas verongulae TaxID=2172824 RepID=UPI0012BB4B77|nr:alpha/beta hydrolase [Sansalvadorimonas verongulae]MTI13218.1 alpha/beta hydrolase [Sansalvadorimonas verongulae]